MSPCYSEIFHEVADFANVPDKETLFVALADRRIA
jgi:hypothetical protein